MEPDGFRRALNAIVQELRNISFLVQKEKGRLPGFEEWYAQWQQEVRGEPIMRWIVESRNRIVKQGDLNLLSRMTVRYHLDWIASAQVEIDFLPGTPLLVGAREVLHQMGNPPFGFLTASRSWTDYRLPGVELLHALATAYGRCADLVETAHGLTNMDSCVIGLTTDECPFGARRPECMENPQDWTEVSLDAATGDRNRLRHHVVDRDQQRRGDVVRRYGSLEDLSLSPRPTDALEAVDIYVELGKRVLAVDSDLMMLVLYFRDSKIVHMEGGKPEDHFGKVLWADHLRNKAVALSATSLLISADIWHARQSGTTLDQAPVKERPDRREALSVIAVAKDGRSISKLLEYVRQSDGAAIFGEVGEGAITWHRYLEPLRQAWDLACWIDGTSP